MTRRAGPVALAVCVLGGWMAWSGGSGRLVAAEPAATDSKVAAVKKTAMDKDPANSEALVKSLQDSDPLVRRFAAYGLQRLGDVAAAGKIAPLLKDPDVWVRRTAAAALGRLGDKEGVPALLAALQDENLFVRIDAFIALGRIGDPASQQGILKAAGDERLWHETFIWDQQSILETMDRPFFTDPALRPFLIKMLDYGKAPHPELADLDDISRQARLTLLPQFAACILAEKFNDSTGESWLLKGLENFDDDYAMQNSMRAVSKLKTKAAIPLVGKILRNEFMNNRRYAMETLGAIGDAEALPLLEPLLKDPDFRQRTSAAAAMEKIEGKKRDVAPDGPPAVIPVIADADLHTPGNKRPPQFIVLGVDDCANADGVEAMLDICETLKARGSKAVFTMWLAPLAGDPENTDMEKKKAIYQKLFDMGCEIAHHTLHHNPGGENWMSLPKEKQVEEIAGCSQWDRDNIVGFTRPFTFKGPGGGHGDVLDRAFSQDLLAKQNWIYRAGRGGHPNTQLWPVGGKLPISIPIGSLDSNAGAMTPVHATITDPIVSDYPGRFDFDVPQGEAMWKANFEYHYNHPRRPILAVNAFHDWGLKALNDAQGKGSHRNESKILLAFLLDVLVTNKDKYPDTYCVTYRQVAEYANTNGDLKRTLEIGNGQDSRNPVKPSVE